MPEQTFQYRVLSKDGEDYKDFVIQKSGMSNVEFTLRDLETKRTAWSKEKQQLSGQQQIEQAKVDNIAHHHPFVLDMKEEDQYAVWMYYEARKGVEEIKKQIAMRVSALDEYITEEQTILKAVGDDLGLEKTNNG